MSFLIFCKRSLGSPVNLEMYSSIGLVELGIFWIMLSWCINWGLCLVQYLYKIGNILRNLNG
jgi:hypothetical protein